MQNQQQEQRLTLREQAACGIGIAYLFLSAHRLAISPFIRNGFGARAHEPHVLYTFGGLMWLSCGYGGFRLYFLCWLAVMAARRVETLRLALKGVRYHTRYQGHPFAAMLMPRVKTEAHARYAEPLLCLAVGLVLVTISEPVGFFVMAGFVSFAGCMAIDAMIDQRRVEAMHDAEMEMRYYAERFRQGR
jgi:hypothetical protein